MVEKLVKLCDYCSEGDEQIAITKCKICGKDLCENCANDLETNFYGLILQQKEDSICTDCDTLIEEINDLPAKENKKIVKQFLDSINNASLFEMLKKILVVQKLQK